MPLYPQGRFTAFLLVLLFLKLGLALSQEQRGRLPKPRPVQPIIQNIPPGQALEDSLVAHQVYLDVLAANLADTTEVESMQDLTSQDKREIKRAFLQLNPGKALGGREKDREEIQEKQETQDTTGEDGQ